MAGFGELASGILFLIGCSCSGSALRLISCLCQPSFANGALPRRFPGHRDWRQAQRVAHIHRCSACIVCKADVLNEIENVATATGAEPASGPAI